MTASYSSSVRFGFGQNWQAYSKTLSEQRIQSAERSLVDLLSTAELAGKRCLDIGSGSGLFSLAARRMGAAVVSIDHDADSVSCTEALQQRYFPNDRRWAVRQGSVLDQGLLDTLGVFDIVYTWGVLHHTGDMRAAMENVCGCVASKGTLVVSLYNDQGWLSKYWKRVKYFYNRLPWSRPILVGIYAPYFVGLRYLVRRLGGRTQLERGMSLWFDMIDWLGGYPFEVARPEAVIDFYHGRGFRLKKLKTCGGRSGCNEFVFENVG
ncbi:MAG: class I SAM-dependent methyltransferase [Gammaproteobacteria bacterium]|nr:class I SAM-dependent methyltransferase [Gammaproteobacteria bacterium]MDH3467939.1 class I SAM-dependent methyltransferase [Gammaproteobacteria bacterium]